MSTQLTYLDRVPETSNAASVWAANCHDFKLTEEYVLINPSLTDLQTVQNDFLGYTNIFATPLRYNLNRFMPIAHPKFPWLVAKHIRSVQGIGSPTKVSKINNLQVDAFDFTTRYPDYRIVVEFGPVDNYILPDWQLSIINPASYFDENGGAQHFALTNEYTRYTKWEIEPLNDVVTAQQGSYKFAAGTTLAGKLFTGMPRMFLRNSLVKFHWYQVPLRFVYSANSLLERYRGYVNQNTAVGGKFYGRWAPGELLYMGYKYVDYVPAVPQYSPFLANQYGFPKCCDITLEFLATNRPTGDTITPANQNFIAAGHNLQPHHTDRRYFHYVTKDGTNNAEPLYYSIPFELLFNDPDA